MKAGINSNHDEMIPLKFLLSQNYPNPFKEKTKIKYCVAYKTRVQIIVYNSNGELIKKLLDENKEAGTYEIEFSPGSESAYRRNEDNLSAGRKGLPCGDYFYQLIAGDYRNTKRMQFEN